MDIPIGKRPVKLVFGFNFAFGGKTKGSNKRKRAAAKRQVVESSDREDGNSDVQVSSPSVPSTPPIRIAAVISSDRRIMEAEEAKKRIKNNDDTEVNGGVFRRGEIFSVAPAPNSKKSMIHSLEDGSKSKPNKQQTSTNNEDTNERSSLEDVKRKKKKKTVAESDQHQLVLQPSSNSRIVLSQTAESGSHLEAQDASTRIRPKKSKHRPFIDLTDYNSEQDEEVVDDDGKDRSKKKRTQPEVFELSDDNASEEDSQGQIMTPPTRNNRNATNDKRKKKKRKNRAPVVLYSDDENEDPNGSCSEVENESVVNGASKHSDLSTKVKSRKRTLFSPDEANEARPSSPLSLPINSKDVRIKLKKDSPPSYDTDLSDNSSEQKEDKMKVTRSIMTSKDDKFWSKEESRQPQLVEPSDDNNAREEEIKDQISQPVMVSPARINVSKRDAIALMASDNENSSMEDVSSKKKKRKKEKTFAESEPQQRIVSSPNPPKVLSQEAESGTSPKNQDANTQRRPKKDIRCSHTDLSDSNGEEEMVLAGPSKKLKKDKDNMIASKVDKARSKMEKRKRKIIVLADEDDSEEKNIMSQVPSIRLMDSPATISPVRSNASEKSVYVLSPGSANDKNMAYRKITPIPFVLDSSSDDENEEIDNGTSSEVKNKAGKNCPSKRIDLPSKANARQATPLLPDDKATHSPPLFLPTNDVQVKIEKDKPISKVTSSSQVSVRVAPAHNDAEKVKYRTVVEFVVDENAVEYFKLQNATPTNMMDVPTELTVKSAGTLKSDILVSRGVNVYPGVRRCTTTIGPDSFGVGYMEIQGKTVLPFEYHGDRTQVFAIIKGSITVKSAGSWYRRDWTGDTTYLHGETFDMGRTIIIKKDTLYSFENREETPALLSCSEILHGNSTVVLENGSNVEDEDAGDADDGDSDTTVIVPVKHN